MCCIFYVAAPLLFTMRLPPQTAFPIWVNSNSILPITQAQVHEVILDSPLPMHQSTLLALSSEHIQSLYFLPSLLLPLWPKPPLSRIWITCNSLWPSCPCLLLFSILLLSRLCQCSTILRGKVRNLNVVPMYPLTSSPITCSLAYFPAAMWLLLSHIKHSPLGPLHLPFSLPLLLFFQVTMWLPYFLHCSSQMQSHQKKPNLITPHKMTTTSHSLIPCHLALL